VVRVSPYALGDERVVLKENGPAKSKVASECIITGKERGLNENLQLSASTDMLPVDGAEQLNKNNNT